MILSLCIRDFVLIDRLDVSPGLGFTALTGETGAGKSIILDALALTLGGAVNKAMIRAGQDLASVSAEFGPPMRHPVWAVLEAHGINAPRDETITLKRLVRHSGPARAFINDQAVSAALLCEVGELMVEIHGQHAASALMRPSEHRKLLDLFAGNEKRLAACAQAWNKLQAARAARMAYEAEYVSAKDQLEWLTHSVEELSKLSPQPGEADQLVQHRSRLMQSERVTEAVDEAEKALMGSGVENALSKAARATDRIARLPGFEGAQDALPVAARSAAEAVERALIETREAVAAVQDLERLIVHDGEALESAEARLFALRAVARKHNADAGKLPELLEELQARLTTVEAGEDALIAAHQAESEAYESWQQTADKLSAARKTAASKLQKAIATELKPLKLGRADVRVSIETLREDEFGPNGADRIEFEAETNRGAGYGPIRKIASGGELARFSLALKCALAEAGSAQTLIFDEADQGVGGAVAAAIGERLVRLAKGRQVMAVTHSPQVAASAADQWLIEKGKGKAGAGGTRVSGLDDGARQEEIARMLSGAKVTKEARAAAGRLMEDA